jgi:hypothetical protein
MRAVVTDLFRCPKFKSRLSSFRMRDKTITPSRDGATAARFLVQLIVYAVFVFAYYFLVLHFWAGWLKWLSDGHRTIYAIVALALMIAQGAVLELFTGWLFRVIHRKAK